MTPFFSRKNERFLHVKPYEYFTKISKIFHMLFLSMFISFRPDRRSGQQIIVCTTRYLPIICNMLYNMNFKLFLVMRPSLGWSVFESSSEPFFTNCSKYHSEEATMIFVWLELGIHLKPNDFNSDTVKCSHQLFSHSTSKTLQKKFKSWQLHLIEHRH